MDRIIVTHNDADGIISVALAFIKFPESKFYVYFTSPHTLKQTLCRIIMKRDTEGELFIFDLSPTRDTLHLSSIFSKVLWIDHHEWNELEIPKNVIMVHDANSSSAAQLVAEYFGIQSELVSIANQIDRNNVRREEAKFFRELVSGVKWKYGRNALLLNNMLKRLCVELALNGMAGLRKDQEMVKLVEESLARREKLERKVMERVKIYKNELKIAVYETRIPIPMYVLVNKLKEHPDYPFDVIAMLLHQTNKKSRGIITRVELRTHTSKNVLSIARLLGGGGHAVACGATIDEFLSVEKLVKIIHEELNKDR